MGVKRRPSKAPYWNFWRAVFAGWLIRYPRFFMKVIGVSLLIPLMIVVSMCTPQDSIYKNDPQKGVNEKIYPR